MPSNAANFDDTRLANRLSFGAETFLNDETSDGINTRANSSWDQLRDLWQGFFSKSNSKLIRMTETRSYVATIANTGDDAGTYQGNRFDESGKDVTFVFAASEVKGLTQQFTLPNVDEQYFLPNGALDISVFEADIDRMVDRLNDRPLSNLGTPTGINQGWYFVHAFSYSGKGKKKQRLYVTRDAEQYAVEPGVGENPGGDPDSVGGV